MSIWQPSAAPIDASGPTLRPKIDVRHLNFFYGSNQALKDVTLPLFDRNVTALNIAFAIQLCQKLSKTELADRVEVCLKRTALWEEVKDKLSDNGLSLSGGQQQRLCIARTIAVEPDVILLDEPCSALDPISTGKIEDLIDELRKDYTIAIVTHNMQQAARVSEFTAFMYLGEVLEFGTTSQIFTAPREKRTENY